MARRRPRWHLHFVPTYSSWLNLVERFFAHDQRQGDPPRLVPLGNATWSPRSITSSPTTIRLPTLCLDRHRRLDLGQAPTTLLPYQRDRTLGNRVCLRSMHKRCARALLGNRAQRSAVVVGIGSPSGIWKAPAELASERRATSSSEMANASVTAVAGSGAIVRDALSERVLTLPTAIW